MGAIKAFVSEYDYLFTIASVFFSFFAFIGVLRVKKRVVSSAEINDYKKRKNTILKELEGFINSIRPNYILQNVVNPYS